MSDDGAAWTRVLTIEEEPKHGYNKYALPIDLGEWRMIRYARYDSSSYSRCRLSELRVSGVRYSTADPTAACDAAIKVRGFCRSYLVYIRSTNFVCGVNTDPTFCVPLPQGGDERSEAVELIV